jgi:hypothetical protein
MSIKYYNVYIKNSKKQKNFFQKIIFLENDAPFFFTSETF